MTIPSNVADATPQITAGGPISPAPSPSGDTRQCVSALKALKTAAPDVRLPDPELPDKTVTDAVGVDAIEGAKASPPS